MSVASPRALSILPVPERPEGVVRTVAPALPGEELDLLREWRDPEQPKFFRFALFASLIVHAIIFVAGTRIASFVMTEPSEPDIIVRKVPLYYRPELTQRAPNKHKLTERFDLQDLIAPQVQQQQQAAAGRRRFVPPSAPKPAPQVQQPQISAEAPKIVPQPTATPPPGVSTGVIAQTVPPPPQTANPFENVGAPPTAKPNSEVALPKTAVPDIVREMARDSRSPQQSVSDNSTGLDTPGAHAMPGRMGSQVELKSDPSGVDLRPYLAQILQIVRRNWFAVMPESVRMGTRRGRTVVQFAVNRDGNIAKVVISDFSGSEPLDRAAVAGLSMSNPLPPLPKQYQGGQLRVAFSFDYNLPKTP
jgi:TonB family protein